MQQYLSVQILAQVLFDNTAEARATTGGRGWGAVERLIPTSRCSWGASWHNKHSQLGHILFLFLFLLLLYLLTVQV